MDPNNDSNLHPISNSSIIDTSSPSPPPTLPNSDTLHGHPLGNDI